MQTQTQTQDPRLLVPRPFEFPEAAAWALSPPTLDPCQVSSLLRALQSRYPVATDDYRYLSNLSRALAEIGQGAVEKRAELDDLLESVDLERRCIRLEQASDVLAVWLRVAGRAYRVHVKKNSLWRVAVRLTVEPGCKATYVRHGPTAMIAFEAALTHAATYATVWATRMERAISLARVPVVHVTPPVPRRTAGQSARSRSFGRSGARTGSVLAPKAQQYAAPPGDQAPSRARARPIPPRQPPRSPPPPASEQRSRLPSAEPPSDAHPSGSDSDS